MEKKIRCAIYIRCSTAEQNSEMQLCELDEFVALKGWSISKVYEDKATGTNMNRLRFQEMMKDARSKKFNILLVWKLDRFARSLKDLIMCLQELSDLGIHFVSIKDQIDLTTSTGRLMLHIIGAFAEFEASIIRERVRAGVRNKISKTGKWGPAPKIDHNEINTLRASGLSIRQIARQVKLSPTSVARALKDVPSTLCERSL